MTADMLRQWVERLCGVSGTPEQLRAALGLPGTTVAYLTGARLDPTPLGAKRVVLYGGPPSRASVDIQLEPGQFTLPMLEAIFGVAQTSPAVGGHQTQKRWWEVRLPGTARRCTVFAHFLGAPDAPNVSATTLVVRTEYDSP